MHKTYTVTSILVKSLKSSL